MFNNVELRTEFMREYKNNIYKEVQDQLQNKLQEFRT